MSEQPEIDDLNRILPGNSLPPVPADFTGPCLIEVRTRHRSGRARWYCPKSQGYTDIPGYAGVYTAEEAAEICNSRDEVYPVDARRVAYIALRSAEKLAAAIGGNFAPLDSELVGYAVRNAHIDRPPEPRWIHVQTALGVGTDTADHLCKRFGLDPQEVAGGDGEEE